MKPAHVEVVGELFAIRWPDATETFLPLETLRRACPCAGCGGEPDVLGYVVRPTVTYNDSSFVMRGFHFVGGYGLQPTWGDGHSSGIYTFEFLKRLEMSMNNAAPRP